jgi:hypothetical protein
MSRSTQQDPARIAVFLDLENLLHPFIERGAVAEGLRRLRSLLGDVAGYGGTLVTCVAVCNFWLARLVAAELADLGVRTFTHTGGEDAADQAMIERIHRDLPPSCGTVVIGSGDGIFAPVADELVRAGRRVEAIGVPGNTSAALRLVANVFHRLTPYDIRKEVG